MPEVIQVHLPRLIGSRADADDLLAGEPLGDAILVVNCRELRRTSPEFADQLVRRALVERGAERIVVIGARSPFAGYVCDAAAAHRVTDRIEVYATLDIPLLAG